MVTPSSVYLSREYRRPPDGRGCDCQHVTIVSTANSRRGWTNLATVLPYSSSEHRKRQSCDSATSVKLVTPSGNFRDVMTAGNVTSSCTWCNLLGLPPSLFLFIMRLCYVRCFPEDGGKYRAVFKITIWEIIYWATGWTIGVRFSAGPGVFLFTTASRKALGPTQPPIQWVPGALSLWVKRPGREADHSSPSAEVKEYVELYLHSPILLHGVVLS
jgi:hypothetical protein